MIKSSRFFLANSLTFSPLLFVGALQRRLKGYRRSGARACFEEDQKMREFKDMKAWRKAVNVACGERLRSIRQSKGYSQNELGRIALVAASSISDAETGKACFTIPILARIAHVLDVPLSDLVPDFSLDDFPEALEDELPGKATQLAAMGLGSDALSA